MDWLLSVSAGIEVNLGFGWTNALTTDNPRCGQELSLASPVRQLWADDWRVFRSSRDTPEFWAKRLNMLSVGQFASMQNKKPWPCCTTCTASGSAFCKTKLWLFITTQQHTPVSLDASQFPAASASVASFKTKPTDKHFCALFRKSECRIASFHSRNTYLSSEQSSSRILKQFSCKRNKNKQLLANIIIANTYVENNVTQ